MADISQLLTDNLHRVFGNRDAADRRRAIEEIFSADVVFADPDEIVVGWDALEAKARGLVESAPADWVFADDGELYLGSDFGALAWAFGPAGAPVARGIDIITVVDGRIVELKTALVPGD